MLEKNILSCINSKLSLCPRRLNCSSAPVHNINNQTEYIPTGVARYTPEQYFSSKKSLVRVRDHIPDEYFTRKKSLDSLYLTDPSVARRIAAKILPHLKESTERVIAECNPGLGLITRQLLKNDIGPIKLFEPSTVFRQQLKKLAAKNSKRIQIYSKNFLRLASYSYADKIDNGNRVEKLLKNVPKKGWTEDPALSVIGSMMNNKFFGHIMASLSTQSSLFAYGRVEMFMIMKPCQYLVLSTDHDLYKPKYDYMTVLFNLFFDYKLLDKLPREGFLPWEKSSAKRTFKLNKIDSDKLYLVHCVSKADLPVTFEELVPFYFFIRKCFNRKARVIPTLEFCVPDCGVHVMIPQLEHEEYFEHLNIFTVFGELTPKQILGTFREMYKHPNYAGSTFSATVDAELIKTEALETSCLPETEKSFIDLQPDEEVELDEHFSEEDLNNI